MIKDSKLEKDVKLVKDFFVNVTVCASVEQCDTRLICQFLGEDMHTFEDNFKGYFSQLEKKSEWCTLTFKRLRQEFSQAIRTEIQREGKLCNFINDIVEEQTLKINLDERFQSEIDNDFKLFLQEYSLARS